jgi:hypothetical protein
MEIERLRERSVIRVRSSYAGGMLTTPKSGRLRSVPLSTRVGKALARFAERGWATGDDERVCEFDGGMEAVDRQPENSSVTIERAE